MTQDELSMHDCTKGLEDGCSCDRVKVKDEWEDDGGDDYGYDQIAQERGNLN